MGSADLTDCLDTDIVTAVEFETGYKRCLASRLDIHIIQEKVKVRIYTT